MAAHVAEFHQPLRGQLALHGEGPPAVLGVPDAVDLGEAIELTSQERVHAQTAARRVEHTAWEGVGQVGDERQPRVVGRHDVRGLREAWLPHARDDERHRVDGEAAPRHRLGVELVGEPDARLEVVLVGLPEGAVAVVGEQDAASHLERRWRDLGDRIGGVGRLRGRSNRQRRGRVPPSLVAIVRVVGRALVLVAEAEVDRQPVVDRPVVLHEHAVVRLVVHALRVAVDEAAGGLA